MKIAAQTQMSKSLAGLSALLLAVYSDNKLPREARALKDQP